VRLRVGEEAGSSLAPARRNSRIRRSPAGIEQMAGAIDVDDKRCVIRGDRLPFRASRSISAQTTRCFNGVVTSKEASMKAALDSRANAYRSC